MIRPVPYREILDAPNAAELFAEYAAECALPELAPVCPQRELYEAMERSGALQAFGVYEHGALVGFAVVLVYTVPHYGRKLAANESIFISMRARAKGYGSLLIKQIKQYARESGCVAFQYTAPVGSRFNRLLSVRDECRHSNSVYLEVLR